jgi:hypothetical protein
MTSDEEKRFPLINPRQGQFETKRELVGVFEQGPLETNKEFAERIFAAFQAHQAKRQASRSKWDRPKV